MRYGNEHTWPGLPALPGASVINAGLSYAGGMIVCAALIAISIDQAARLSAPLLTPALSPPATHVRDTKVSGASNAAIIAAAEARHTPRAATLSTDHPQPSAGASRYKKVLVKLARR
jgi:hypothetical protein